MITSSCNKVIDFLKSFGLTLGSTVIVRSIVISVVFAWMFNFVEITSVVKVLHMTSVASAWR